MEILFDIDNLCLKIININKRVIIAVLIFIFINFDKYNDMIAFIKSKNL